MGQYFGYSIGLGYQLIVNTVDGNEVPISGMVVEIYKDGLLVTSKESIGGSAKFGYVGEVGDYEITTSNSDRMQSFSLDGASQLEVDYIILGITKRYRVKALGEVQDSDWSNELTVRL